MLDLVEFLGTIVPVMLNNHLLVLELILSTTVHEFIDGIQILAHISIRCLEGFNALLIHLSGFIIDHACRKVKALRLKPELQLLKMLSELLVLEGHLVVSICGVIVINA